MATVTHTAVSVCKAENLALPVVIVLEVRSIRGHSLTIPSLCTAVESRYTFSPGNYLLDVSPLLLCSVDTSSLGKKLQFNIMDAFFKSAERAHSLPVSQQ